MEPGRTIQNRSEPIGSFKHLRGALSRIKKATGETYRNSRTQALYYIPGVFLLGMGFSLMFAPSVFVGLSSGLLLYIGVMALFLGRKAMIASDKFREVVKQVEARIYVRGHAPQGPVQWEEQAPETTQGPDKKTVLH